jgi:hypothetical protein
MAAGRWWAGVVGVRGVYMANTTVVVGQCRGIWHMLLCYMYMRRMAHVRQWQRPGSGGPESGGRLQLDTG